MAAAAPLTAVCNGGAGGSACGTAGAGAPAAGTAAFCGGAFSVMRWKVGALGGPT